MMIDLLLIAFIFLVGLKYGIAWGFAVFVAINIIYWAWASLASVEE